MRNENEILKQYNIHLNAEGFRIFNQVVSMYIANYEEGFSDRELDKLNALSEKILKNCLNWDKGSMFKILEEINKEIDIYDENDLNRIKEEDSYIADYLFGALAIKISNVY